MYIYLNPQYVIRNENNCSYIIAKSALITAKLEYAMAFASVVPPSIGYILSHIECFNRKYSKYPKYKIRPDR